MNKKNDKDLICDMIVLGVHMSGVIGCDVETRRIPPSAVGQYFGSEKARIAIRSCIEKAKDNPLRLSRNKQIQVQVTPRIGLAIKTGETESVLGLKEFLEEISEETDAVTVIGRAASEDEVLPIITSRTRAEANLSRVRCAVERNAPYKLQWLGGNLPLSF
jgi:hypothetical protein